MSTNILQTTLTAAINQKATTLAVASATGIVAPTNQSASQQKLYIIDPDGTKGELMLVSGSPNGLLVPVSRIDQFKASHTSGSIVLIAPLDPTFGGFQEFDPSGNPSVTGSYPGVPFIVPWLNVNNGNQWLAGILGQWVPGWNNPSAQKGVTAAVASVAGPITPSGPLFHITGALAITGITMPIGCAGGSFTVIPDGTFTWTTGDGSIGLAGTAVVGKALTFTYDSNALKWYPSYIA